MHIAIAGNIGAGKTTLTELLAQHYHWKAHYEQVDNNPYLYDFYADMQRWAFNLQIFFLTSRFSTIKEIKESKKTIIQDRTIYEDAQIFAPNLYEMGLMSERDFNNYTDLFSLMEKFLTAPDLLIYLKASVSTLVEQIYQRGREYENSISIDYLGRLNERYDNWATQYNRGKLLVIEVDHLNFVAQEEDFLHITQQIDKQLL